LVSHLHKSPMCLVLLESNNHFVGSPKILDVVQGGKSSAAGVRISRRA
jgi:hypothetical protein